ncbi:hypothetical protein EXIGLDRAFT_707037 [Exidia glandulosa HHB12029]|uniref:Uncharacterized protein n=1 Tax=Exidia glandulosa HHB12029 TaxID=1314781 RepID=A0A165AWC9_EXIGL|nr:hypothetical protein EXIGLDRAFT_707037 [Exidia glandulosa HHB12029]
MTDVIDTSSFGELFNVPAANTAELPRDMHEPAPSEDDSIPDLEPAVQPPHPAYEDTPVEPNPYLMLSYEVRQVWRLSAELHAALAHIKLLADIILHQAPAPGRSPYIRSPAVYHHVVRTRSPQPTSSSLSVLPPRHMCGAVTISFLCLDSPSLGDVDIISPPLPYNYTLPLPPRHHIRSVSHRLPALVVSNPVRSWIVYSTGGRFAAIAAGARTHLHLGFLSAHGVCRSLPILLRVASGLLYVPANAVPCTLALVYRKTRPPTHPFNRPLPLLLEHYPYVHKADLVCCDMTDPVLLSSPSSSMPKSDACDWVDLPYLHDGEFVRGASKLGEDLVETISLLG